MKKFLIGKKLSKLVVKCTEIKGSVVEPDADENLVANNDKKTLEKNKNS